MLPYPKKKTKPHETIIAIYNDISVDFFCLPPRWQYRAHRHIATVRQSASRLSQALSPRVAVSSAKYTYFFIFFLYYSSQSAQSLCAKMISEERRVEQRSAPAKDVAAGNRPLDRNAGGSSDPTTTARTGNKGRKSRRRRTRNSTADSKVWWGSETLIFNLQWDSKMLTCNLLVGWNTKFVNLFFF